MAQYDVLILNETVVPPQIQEIQAGDTYRLGADTEVVGNLTVSGTVNGADVAATAALAASATQPGDNLSTLVNDILASQAEAEAGSNNTKMMTPLRVAQAIAVLAAGLKNKLDAVSAPVSTNDDSEGYSVGSFWVDVTNDESYRCVDATTNLAVWVKTTLQTSDLATVALSGDSDDLIEGSTKKLMTATERTKLGYLTVTGAVDLDAHDLAISEGWRDLRCALVGTAAGSGTPTLTAFGPSGNIKQMAFGIGDSVYVAAHVDHDVKPGSTMYPHVHWSTSGTDTNSVRWEVRYIAAAGHNQANFGTDTVIQLTEAAHGTAWRHMITEDGTGFIAPEVDSVILMEIKRVTNGGTDNLNTVFGLFVDLHYQSDRNATPNRVPNFYT